MLEYISKSKKSIVFSTLLLLVGFASFIFAQNQAVPKKAPAGEMRQIYVVNLVRVQLGMERQWQDVIKKEALPALKNGGVSEYIVLRRDTFGGTGEFMMFRLIKDLAELDEPDPAVKALGQAGETALIAKLDRVTASVRTVEIVTRPDLSIVPSGYEPKLVAMTRVTVAPGRIADFEKGAIEQLALIGKTNVKGTLVARVSDGGDPNEYWQSLLLDSYADLGQLNSAYRKAATEAKLAPMPAGIVMHAERSTWRYVPELSIRTSAQKTTK